LKEKEIFDHGSSDTSTADQHTRAGHQEGKILKRERKWSEDGVSPTQWASKVTGSEYPGFSSSLPLYESRQKKGVGKRGEGKKRQRNGFGWEECQRGSREKDTGGNQHGIYRHRGGRRKVAWARIAVAAKKA